MLGENLTFLTAFLYLWMGIGMDKRLFLGSIVFLFVAHPKFFGHTLQ